MADDPNYLLQLGDQCMNMAGKFDKMIPMIQDLSNRQAELTQVAGSLVGITTAVEIATAVALTLSGISLYLTIKWRTDRYPHNQPLPVSALLPKPKTYQPKVTEEEVEGLLKYIKTKNDQPIDSLAELAQELNGRNK